MWIRRDYVEEEFERRSLASSFAMTSPTATCRSDTWMSRSVSSSSTRLSYSTAPMRTALLGPCWVRKEPRRPKDRQDNRGLDFQPVYDAIVTEDDLTHLISLELANDTALMWESLKPISCFEQALNHEAAVARGITFDEHPNRRQVIDGLRSPADTGHPRMRRLASSRLTVSPASA